MSMTAKNDTPAGAADDPVREEDFREADYAWFDRPTEREAFDRELGPASPAPAASAGVKGATERDTEAPIYEAFARYVGNADERASDFRMFATGYHAAPRAPAAVPDALRTAAQTVMDAFSSDCVDGERQYPDDPAYNLNDKGKIKLTTGMVWGLRDALDALAARPVAEGK